MAEQIEEVLHPSNLAIVLVDERDTLCVALSHGSLASTSQWQEGAVFDPGHIVPAQLANRCRPLDLVKHSRNEPSHSLLEGCPLNLQPDRFLQHDAIPGRKEQKAKIRRFLLPRRELESTGAHIFIHYQQAFRLERSLYLPADEF